MGLRELQAEDITSTIRRLCIQANTILEDDVIEAIRRMQVEDFPATVVNDIYGNDLYQQGKKRYRKIG